MKPPLLLGLFIVIVLSLQGEPVADWRNQSDVLVPRTIVTADEIEIILWKPINALPVKVQPSPTVVTTPTGTMTAFTVPPQVTQKRYVLKLSDRVILKQMAVLLQGGTINSPRGIETGVYMDPMATFQVHGENTLKLFESGENIFWVTPNNAGKLRLGKARVTEIKAYLTGLGDSHKDELILEPAPWVHLR